MKLETRSISPHRTTPTPLRAPARQPRPQSPAFGQSGFDDGTVSARERAERLGEVLPRPQAVSQDITSFMPPARAVALHGPEALSSFDFRGTRAPAQRYLVEVGDRKIPVVVGQGSVEPGMRQPEINTVALALSRLPPEALEGITEIHLSPFRNPDDAAHASAANPDFRSDMTNGTAGDVTMYPRPTPVGDDFMAATLLHESAHAFSMRAWGTGENTPQWRAWGQAGLRDGQRPSDYAEKNLREDLSETAAIYLATRGTSRFETYRAEYPNRFAILDTLLGDPS